MTRPTPRRSAAIAIALCAALVLLAAPSVDAGPGGGGKRPSHLRGAFTETEAGAGLGYDIAGTARLRVGPHGTRAQVKITGLDPAKRYGSHLHNLPCAQSGGGGHYQNVEGGATTPPNELWLSSTNDPQGPLVPNPHGTAHGKGTAPWLARLTSTTQTNARAIVVHEPGSGTRIACADLG